MSWLAYLIPIYIYIYKQECNVGHRLKAARFGRLLLEQLFGSGGFLRSRGRIYGASRGAHPYSAARTRHINTSERVKIAL